MSGSVEEDILRVLRDPALLATLLFATMGVCIKFASDHFNPFEIVAYRGMVGVVFIIGMTRVRGVSLRTQLPMMHFWRAVLGVTGAVGQGAEVAAVGKGLGGVLHLGQRAQG